MDLLPCYQPNLQYKITCLARLFWNCRKGVLNHGNYYNYNYGRKHVHYTVDSYLIISFIFSDHSSREDSSLQTVWAVLSKDGSSLSVFVSLHCCQQSSPLYRFHLCHYYRNASFPLCTQIVLHHSVSRRRISQLTG